MIRILRVLRVFRVFRLGRRLRSEVQARLLTLIFTLLAIIVTSAGLFYEIETRYGVCGACFAWHSCSLNSFTAAAASIGFCHWNAILVQATLPHNLGRLAKVSTHGLHVLLHAGSVPRPEDESGHLLVRCHNHHDR